MKKILILVNDVTTILHYRSELVLALVQEGSEVIVGAPKSNRIREIEDLGAKVIETTMERRGKNLFKDLKLLALYKKVLKELKPDIVLTFTIKPNVYGGMACGKLKIPCIANVTGLGAVVENRGVMQHITLFLHRIGFKKANCVFFQNQANMNFFINKKIVSNNAYLLPGSGVNLNKFQYMEYPDKTIRPINIVFVGRIMKVKGVFEIAKAAKSLQERTDISFTIVGDIEEGTENPFVGIRNVNCVGFHKDVRPFLKDAHAVILASYHEGLANVLLEGAACGRPVLATRVHGCRETFDEGVTGFGFEPKDVDSLKQALITFLELPHEEKMKMGVVGRKKVETQYDRRIVIETYKNKIKQLTEE